MFADVVINTSPVFTGNVALLAPAGTVTLEGTLAAKLLLASATRAPPAGAGVLSVTVPVEDCSPPTTVDGFKLIDATVGSGTGFTVSVAVLVVPPYAALIATVVGAVTALYELSKSKLGYAPSDEKEFKKAMQTVSVKPQNFKVDSFDELLISERDGQPLTVVYGPAAANSNFIVSEQTGVNGKRMVGLRTGIVEEIDDAQYKALMALKR